MQKRIVNKWSLLILILLLLAHTIVLFTTLQTISQYPAQTQAYQAQQAPNRAAYNPPSRSGTPRAPVTIEAIVTAYTKNDPGMDGKGITFTGTKARPGVAAVDPKVIPLGTVLFVPGYGYARAEDTGSAIRGNHIDLYFESRNEALKWGKKRMHVEIVHLSPG